jgi:class 3 adenylate cyclase/tetratricopeptide (TPR) repeat protein
MSKPMSQGHRRLAAIMFTDIVGYTSLSQKNEPLSLELLEEHRRLLRPIISEHSGTEVKTIGDAFLVEFSSAIDSVRCAYDIQRALNDRDQSSESEKKIAIRVGIHFGDVVHADGDVYGNCVNIASRVEPLADAGGICVTGELYDKVKDAGDLNFDNLGEHDLKNVDVPVSVFKVILPWQANVKLPEQRLGLKGPPGFQSTPFVDRDIERARLSAMLEQITTTGTGASKNVVLIGGEAGAGKTRLVDWFIRECMQRGMYAAKGFCQADITIPFFPFSEALEKLLSENNPRPGAGAVDLAEWLRISARADPVRGGAEGRDQMFEGTLRLLERLSRRSPLVICLEDVHWADPSTLALLQYLARNMVGLGILFVCTYRVEELSGESAGRLHPLKETILLMSRTGCIERIELAGMGDGYLREIGASVLGPASAGVLDLLTNESEGNPLYAVEYARLLKEESPGQAGIGDSASTQIPGSVYDLILRRLAHLKPEERRLVDFASLIGERFEPDLVSDSLGLDRLSVTKALDAVARETRVLREEIAGDGVDRFFFEHAKIREVAINELSPSVRRGIHKRIATTLLEKYHGENVEETVFHFRQAGMGKEVLKLAPIAGDRARRRYANAEAVTYYNWALEAWTGQLDEGTPALRLRSLIGRAEASYSLGLNEQALKDANEALQGTQDPKLKLQAIRICAESCFDLGHFTESLDFCNLQSAQGDSGRDSLVDRMRTRSVHAVITGYRGDPKGAIDELADTARQLKDVGERKQYAMTLGSIREFKLTMLDIQGALQSAEEATSIFRELGDQESEMMASRAKAGIFAHKGDIRNADSGYSRAAELGNKLGLYSSLTWIYLYWGLMHEAGGKYEKALELSLKALDNAKLAETPYGETAVRANLVKCYIRANQKKDAEDAYLEMNRLFEQHGEDASLTLRAAVQRSRGFYHASLGQRALADSEYASSIALLHRGPLGPYHEAMTRKEYGLILLEEGRRSEAEAQLSESLRIQEKLGNDNGIRQIQETLSSFGQSVPE